MSIKPEQDKALLARYKRARVMEEGARLQTLERNATPFPNWIRDSDHFWYIRKTKTGKEFRLVNAEKATNTVAFDHTALARALGQAINRKIDAKDLPISQVSIDLKPHRVAFFVLNKSWNFDVATGSCKEIATPPAFDLVSPDGKKSAFIKDHNLWVRDINTGKEKALTQDGELHNTYGVLPERIDFLNGPAGARGLSKTEGLWSPNSRYLLTVQTDERKVLSLPLMQHIPDDETVRPKVVECKYGLPGDEHIAEYKIFVVDMKTGRVQAAKYPNVLDAVMYASLFEGNRAWWSADGTKAWFVDMTRHLKGVRVVELDAASGKTRVLFEEKSDSHIDLDFDYETYASLMHLPETDELIWWSERSGWAHLYLYDLKTGKLKNTITQGDWVVRETLQFDAQRRELFVTVAGRVPDRDPYYREVCRVNVDTGKITTLVSGNEDYIVYKPGTKPVYVFAGMGVHSRATMQSAGVSPSGNYFVMTRTRVDEPPVTELRDRSGAFITKIETMDTSDLPKGWQWPEPVAMKAADGKTDIYGVIFRPTNFDPKKKYPVIDLAFTNSFYAAVPKGAFCNDTIFGYFYLSAAAWAELGFIVTVIDGRGSVYRSKAFHDHSYGQVEKGSDLEDHVAGIKQLAKRYPYMDLDRVGIVDSGGSDGPVYGLLAYPDFYKVGAVTAVWDPRLIMQGDVYQGPDAYDGQWVLSNMAGNLKGKLLIVQGMLDNYFHPAGMFQLIDAFVKANKNFDMVVMPTAHHPSLSGEYGLRRMWDYMVTHLQDKVPPTDFKLRTGGETLRYRMREDALVGEERS